MKILALKPGPKVGEITKSLIEKQLSHEIKNREEAMEWVKTS